MSCQCNRYSIVKKEQCYSSWIAPSFLHSGTIMALTSHITVHPCNTKWVKLHLNAVPLCMLHVLNFEYIRKSCTEFNKNLKNNSHFDKKYKPFFEPSKDSSNIFYLVFDILYVMYEYVWSGIKKRTTVTGFTRIFFYTFTSRCCACWAIIVTCFI